MRKGSAGSSGQGLRLWLLAALASLLLLPWYGLEGGLPGGWHAARPALLEALSGGRLWLLPLAPPLLLAAWAAWARSSGALVAAGLAGIAWLLVEAFGLRAHGLRLEGLAALLEGSAAQPALGWGALLYALSCLMLCAHGLAWRGWCKGEVFLIGAIGIVCGSILVFVGYPVACVLVSAFQDNEGAFDLLLFAGKITDASIWSLDCLAGGRHCGVAWNSLAQAVLVGVLSTLLGLAFALVATRTRFPFPRLLRIMSVLPVITPPFVIGLALILIFGRAGIVSSLLQDWFDIRRSRWLYGMPGLTIAQLLAFTPISFLVLQGVLQGVSPSMEEASQTLRSGRWRTFRLVTWPLIRPGLANAFLIAFIESLADFGNPIMIGGNFQVLSTSIYFAVVGAAHDQGQAAVLAIVLLVFTLSAFLLQRFWIGRRSYVTVSGKGDAGLPLPLAPWLHRACLAIVLPWLALTAAVYGIILVGGFVKAIGQDNSLTLDHFLTAFAIEQGPHGWFLAGSAWNSLTTTLMVAVLAMPLTAALGILTGYLLNRQSFAGRATFEFLTMMSFAIPGTVIGISYILAFNVPPLELTGTALIMVIAFVFRNMPVGIRASIANLSQVDRSLDEASLTLGARSAATLRRVILPILRPAIATSMVYAFVRAITSVSAVIFLVSGEYNLATVYIVGRAEFGEFGIAIVYSAVLIVIMVAALLSIQALVGERRIGRRKATEAAGSRRPAAAGA
ncbi:iron ABC transporter permease [Roseomonas sp. GC11]|uniref:ABC transporter permease n=1 Tax=Roseomonas sp. GC11 TaxID=2950546 RepID=UPI00210D02A0|nr:iron ABC transporter permease [Roseomonas sp. GC11]MCQ4162384.1 iron ABC transporter permease [Roseomonas sp. GC11]